MSERQREPGRAKPGSSVSSAALFFGIAAPLCAVGGAWLANRGVVSPFAGFRMFLLALPLSLAAITSGTIVLFLARGGRNRWASRKAAVAWILAALSFGTVLGLAAPGAPYPLINDITTDLEDPPAFVAARRLQPDAGEMKYRPAMAAEQKRAYPAVKSRVLPIPPDVAFQRVIESMKTLRNLSVIDASEGEGRIEAVAVSRVFRFTDDVVVRIRPEEPAGSRVDVRSRSRDGKGDLGVNAHRIENLLAVLH